MSNYNEKEFAENMAIFIDALQKSKRAISPRIISRRTGIKACKLPAIVLTATYLFPIYEDCMGRIGILKDNNN